MRDAMIPKKGELFFGTHTSGWNLGYNLGYLLAPARSAGPQLVRQLGHRGMGVGATKSKNTRTPGSYSTVPNLLSLWL